MSDQREAGTTSLEEVFLSREFGSRDFARAAPRTIALDGVTEEVANPAELEEVFRSVRFGRPRVCTPPRLEPAAVDLAVTGEAEIVALRPWDSTRHRAIAAVSGIAAAALVVAGVASGGGHPGRPDVSAAQGQRVNPGSQQSVTTPTGSSPTAPASGTGTPTAITVAATSGGVGEAPATTVVVPDGATGPKGSVIVEAPPGTSVTVVPSSAAADNGSTGTSGGGGGSPAPTPTSPSVTGSGSPLAPTVVAVGNTVTGSGTTVTSTLGRVGSAVPTVAPVNGMLGGVGATVSGLGQSLDSTAA